MSLSSLRAEHRTRSTVPDADQGIAHVHWHVVPLPPGVPYDKQQGAWAGWRRGVLEISQEEMPLLAWRIGAKLGSSAGTTHTGRTEMIIRKDQAPVDRGTEEDEQTYGARESLHLSEVGRLTQFVAHVQTLQPGSRSSDRHWHEEEDELLYMLSGEALVIEDDGAHVLHPGDAACWPAGVANAHQVVNRSGAPCSYLIFGSGAVPDVVHYPEQGEVLRAFEDGRWRLERIDGTLIKEGREP